MAQDLQSLSSRRLTGVVVLLALSFAGIAEAKNRPVFVTAKHRPTTAPAHAGYRPAKFEPARGCYFGAYVEADETLGPIVQDHHGQMTREEAFGQVVHKHLATAFVYCHYGDPFPVDWARALLAAGITPQVAFEPGEGLDAVTDDSYLRNFVKDAASCSGPIFLRFACEMNGNWVPWFGNPTLYRQKFRFMHDLMARRAPNVAMIWCVNDIPEELISVYYPGDAWVDWVGVDFYSVLHHNNRADRPATQETPSERLQYVYDHYASRKPIAICEYGASHQDAVYPDQDRSDVASAKLRDLLGSLQRRYPRVKLIDLFDCNALKHAPPGRRLNNYCVTDSDVVLGAVRKLVSSPYFLSYPARAPAGSDLYPAPGEVRIEGKIARVNIRERTITLAATRILMPDGQSISFPQAQPRLVHVPPGTLLRDAARSETAIRLQEVERDTMAFVVGQGSGAKGPIVARIMDVQSTPLLTMPNFSYAAALRSDRGPRGSVVWKHKPDN